MSTIIVCREVGLECDGVVQADGQEEALAAAAAHVREAHGLEEMPPELVERVRSVMREG